MRSKRSKQWHRRGDPKRVREIIEHGLDRVDIAGEFDEGSFVVCVHPSLEADLRKLMGEVALDLPDSEENDEGLPG
jgi:hypothetical protein